MREALIIEQQDGIIDVRWDHTTLLVNRSVMVFDDGYLMERTNNLIKEFNLVKVQSGVVRDPHWVGGRVQMDEWRRDSEDVRF